MATPKQYISAYSWNGTEFYFNVHELTWQMADNTVLTEQHEATAVDITDARICARNENFAADRIGLHTYTSADL